MSVTLGSVRRWLLLNETSIGVSMIIIPSFIIPNTNGKNYNWLGSNILIYMYSIV